jgi:flagellar biogenesis protein FliO
MEWIVVKTLLSLIAVLGLMAGVLLVVKKMFYGDQSSKSSLVDIQVLGYRALQPKRSLYVLKVLNRVYVVGSSENGIHAIGEFEHQVALEETPEKQKYNPGFPQWLALLRLAKRGDGRAFADQLTKETKPFVAPVIRKANIRNNASTG